MTKRQHFERWIKQVKPNLPLDYSEQEGYYYHDIVSLMWQAWQASPKTRPTEPGRITKEQLGAMKADTTNIVDHLRGIYAGAASRYPVTPLAMKAADEIERLREVAGEMLDVLDDPNPTGMQLLNARDSLRAALNKKPAEAG